MIDERIERGKQAAIATNALARKLLEKRKAGIDKAMLRIAQAMDATKISYFQEKGRVTDKRVDVDHAIRLTSAKHVTDIYDALPAKRHEVKHDANESVMSAVVEVLAERKRVKANDVKPKPKPEKLRNGIIRRG